MPRVDQLLPQIGQVRVAVARGALERLVVAAGEPRARAASSVRRRRSRRRARRAATRPMNSPIASAGGSARLPTRATEPSGMQVGDLALVERVLGAALVDRAELAIDHEPDLGGRARGGLGDRGREHDVAVRQVRRLIEVRARARERQQHVVGLPLGVVDEHRAAARARARTSRARRRDSRGSRPARSTPTAASARHTQPRIGRPATSTMHFGISSVCAPSRLPRPAAIRIARSIVGGVASRTARA